MPTDPKDAGRDNPPIVHLDPAKFFKLALELYNAAAYAVESFDRTAGKLNMPKFKEPPELVRLRKAVIAAEPLAIAALTPPVIQVDRRADA